MKDNIWTEVNMDELLVRGCEPPKEEVLETAETEQGTPLTAAQRSLVKELDDPNAEKRNCFGGVLLSRTDGDNKPILSFVVTDMTDREAVKMKAEYKDLFRSGLTGMIYGADPFVERFENYTVFNFLHNTSRISLREYCDKCCKQIPTEKIMRKLLKVLVDRYNCSEDGYKSLNCFSLDTIFVDPRGALWILPLRAFRNCFPCEIAPEAHDPNQPSDERSDLYAAAYIAQEVANGGTLCDMQHLEDSVFKDCLLGMYQCRPSLRRVAQLFSVSDSADRTATEETNITISKIKPHAEEKASGHTDCGLVEKLQSQWKRFCGKLKKCWVTEPERQLCGTLEAGKRPAFRPIKPIQDSDEENV